MEVIFVLFMAVFGIAFGIRLVKVLMEFIYKVAPGVIMFIILLMAYLMSN